MSLSFVAIVKSRGATQRIGNPAPASLSRTRVIDAPLQLRSYTMKKHLLAAAAALFAGAPMTPAPAADSYYLLSVDILGADGGVTLHKQVKCPRYDDCREKFPVIIEGMPQTLFLMGR